MTIEFNQDGHALSSGTLTVYGYDQISGLYTGSYEATIIEGYGIPGNSTIAPPPEAPAGKAPVFRDGAWQLVEDHRDAAVWNKGDGSRASVTAPGPIPDTLTTVEPTGPFVVWDDQKSGWVFNQALRDSQMKAAAAAALQQARQSVYNNYGILGEPTPADWITYLKALMAIANGTDTTSTELPAVPSDLTT